MSTVTTSPMRGTRRAAGGSSEYSTVAINSPPAPAAKSISVAPGARLTIRSGGSRTSTSRPRSSVTVLARGPVPYTPREALSPRVITTSLVIDIHVMYKLIPPAA